MSYAPKKRCRPMRRLTPVAKRFLVGVGWGIVAYFVIAFFVFALRGS